MTTLKFLDQLPDNLKEKMSEKSQAYQVLFCEVFQRWNPDTGCYLNFK